MSSQESYFGLGFPNGRNDDGNSKATTTRTTASAGSTTTSTAPLNVDALMQSYMQQCLSYHEQKQKENVHQHQNQNNIEKDGQVAENRDSSHHAQTPAFIPATATAAGAPSSANMSIKHEMNTNDVDGNNNNASPVRIGSSNVKDEEKDDFQQRLENAKMIAQRLASKPIPIPPTETVPSSVVIPVSVSSSSSSNHHHHHHHHQQPKQDDYYPYAQKRDHFLTKVHSTKLHSFFLKNLNYILKKDEEVHSIQMQYLQRQQEISLHNKKRKRQHQQRNGNMNVMGGIGTQERSQYQKSIERSQHSFMTKNKKKKQPKSCALYISGIKKIATVSLAQAEENALVEKQEQMIHELFESYGSISKINYYVDKQSGLRKGDAFILYNWDEICKQQLQKEKEKYNGTDQGQDQDQDQVGEDKNNSEEDENRKVDSFLKVICDQVREDRNRVLFLFFFFTQPVCFPSRCV